MPHIPSRVKGFPRMRGMRISVHTFLLQHGFTLWHMGKVRNTYKNNNHPGLLFVVATDRLSIFDFVLPVLVAFKGEVLTALTHHWLMHVLQKWPHHLVPSQLNPNFNAAYDFAQIYPGFPVERILVVRELEMQLFELIFRGHIGGSVWADYEATSTVTGILLPEGLMKWQKLPDPIFPLFTPSSKAENDHDINLTQAYYFNAMGEGVFDVIESYRSMYREAYDYALAQGIIIADTKFEGDPYGTVGDEILTPDSSRFIDREELVLAQRVGRNPRFLDKQPVRDEGEQIKTPWGAGINKLQPSNANHLAFVDSIHFPKKIIKETTQRYLYIVKRLTGKTLREYQQTEMGVSA